MNSLDGVNAAFSPEALETLAVRAEPGCSAACSFLSELVSRWEVVEAARG